MALKLTKQTFHGIDVDYFRIDEIRYKKQHNNIHVKVGGYVDKTAQPLIQENFNIPVEDVEGAPNNISMEKVYNVLKTLDFFTGALDN